MAADILPEVTADSVRRAVNVDTIYVRFAASHRCIYSIFPEVHFIILCSFDSTFIGTHLIKKTVILVFNFLTSYVTFLNLLSIFHTLFFFYKYCCS